MTQSQAPRTILRQLALAAGLVAALPGCSGGGFGDLPSKPLANEFGDGSRLCDVVGPGTAWEDPGDKMSMHCMNVPPDHQVYVTGVTVVAIDRFDETGSKATGNYYIQDTSCGGKPFSGVTVFGPSFSPPDLRLAQGDVVDVLGSITEFLGPSSGNFGQCRSLPEVSGTLTFRFDSVGDPAPVVVPVADLKSYDTARQYLGMLVKVENLTIANDGKPSGGRYSADIDVGGGVAQADVPKITNELYDMQKEGPTLSAMTMFKSVTGVVTYFYGFHLSPRSLADFEM